MKNERNRTVARFEYHGQNYTIHERTNYTSDGRPFTRRFICKPDGRWGGEARTVREARIVLDKQARGEMQPI